MREVEEKCRFCNVHLVHNRAGFVFCTVCKLMYFIDSALKDPAPTLKCQKEYCHYCVKAQTVWCSFIPFGWDEDRCEAQMERDHEHGRKKFGDLVPPAVALGSPYRLRCCAACMWIGHINCKPDFIPHCNAIEVCRNRYY